MECTRTPSAMSPTSRVFVRTSLEANSAVPAEAAQLRVLARPRRSRPPTRRTVRVDGAPPLTIAVRGRLQGPFAGRPDLRPADLCAAGPRIRRSEAASRTGDEGPGPGGHRPQRRPTGRSPGRHPP